jgi:hypothetical protein
MADDATATEHQASRLERAVLELEQATLHYRVAASHLRDAEIPRAAAHAWAAEGHLVAVRREAEDAALDHARHSRP